MNGTVTHTPTTVFKVAQFQANYPPTDEQD